MAKKIIYIEDSAEMVFLYGTFLKKYGYEVNGRRWSVMSVERTDFIRMLDKEELLISAEEWDQD